MVILEIPREHSLIAVTLRQVIHTARWPQEYHKQQWKNERVAVIGSGASSIQTVPTMQPHVKHMDVFVRTGK